MDPLTAVGLVANIFQFISFSHKLLSSAKEIYSSTQGVSKEVEQLKLLTLSVQENSRSIVKTAQSHQDEDKAVLKGIAAECEKLADELLKRLGKLEVKGEGLARKWDAIKISREFSWKKKEIYGLQARLFELEKRLNKWWKETVAERQNSFLLDMVRSLARNMEQLEARSPKGDLETLHDSLNKEINILKQTARSHEEILRKELSAMTREELRLSREKKTTTHIDALSKAVTMMQKFSTDTQKIERQREVIQSLIFTSIKRRYGEIDLAHKDSLHWIFDKSKTTFLDWLENGSGVFWVNGLAGSGKSTLMKFVADHPQTSAALQNWSGNQPVIIAGHYFWNAGKDMQRSQQGLFQSLLYHLLRTVPSLVDVLCPDHLAKDPWDIDELKKALQSLTGASNLNTKFCFFIDGLDEYEGVQEDIVFVVKYLASSPHIKVCASSRPWTAFSSEWMSTKQTLKVQDFTKDDMAKYTREILAENERFQCLASKDLRAYNLVREISDRASGVWLWVYLVVRDLLRDMRDNEPYEHLMIRLNSYPPELSQYFENIMKRIDKIHKEQSAQIFLLVVAAVRPLSILTLSVLHTYNDAEFSLKCAIKSASEDEVLAIYHEWQPRLQNRCRDLLKIVTDPSEPSLFKYQIDFLHRSVRDFLRDNHQDALRSSVPQGFDPTIFLSRLMLILIKRLDVKQFRLRLNPLIALVDELLHYAWQIEQYPSKKYTAAFQKDLIDELDRTMSSHAHDEVNHWTNARDPPSGDGEEPWFEGGQINLLALAIQAHLRLYVKQKLEEDGSLMKKPARPLLDYALRPKRVSPIVLPENIHYDIPLLNEALIATLLDHGADPNHKIRIYQQRTPWLLFLFSCRKNWSLWPQSTKESVFVVIKLLLRHGADPSIQIPPVTEPIKPNAMTARYNEPVVVERVAMHSCSILDFFDDLFDPAKKMELEELVFKITEAKKRSAFSKFLGWSRF